MSKSIWERRLEIERQERAERDALLAPHRARFEVQFNALKEECEQVGHEWAFSTMSMFGYIHERCQQCAKTRSRDPDDY
jgi:hypothetical protein